MSDVSVGTSETSETELLISDPEAVLSAGEAAQPDSNIGAIAINAR